MVSTYDKPLYDLIEIIQRFQSKMLQIISDASLYITNKILHDLNVSTVRDEIVNYTRTYHYIT